MWCSNCRQDVPGVAVANQAAGADGLRGNSAAEFLRDFDRSSVGDARSATSDKSKFVCARCGKALATTTDDRLHVDADFSVEDRTRPSRPSTFDTWQWELDQELHDVRQLLAARNARQQTQSDAVRKSHIAMPAENDNPGREHLKAAGLRIRTDRAHEFTRPQRSSQTTEKPKSGGFAWFVLSLGVMALACGGVLIGWSLVTDRLELWSLGLPVLLGGQAVMLVGLLLLLERMWRDSRRATDRFESVDGQIDDLRQTTTMLRATPANKPHEFYTHLTDGAHPSLLLADLKSQLDVLSDKLTQRQ